jgi:hypothetical protein
MVSIPWVPPDGESGSPRYNGITNVWNTPRFGRAKGKKRAPLWQPIENQAGLAEPERNKNAQRIEI